MSRSLLGKGWMRTFVVLFIVLVVLAAVYAVLIQQGYLPSPIIRDPLPTPALATTRDERWVQDIRYLAHNLAYLHPNAFHAVSQEAFEAQVAHLIVDVPTLTDAEIWVGIAEITALVDDGHTEPWLHEPGFFRLYPLRLNWYGSDLVVTGAHPDYAQALGSRVTHIGTMDVERAFETVERVISYDNVQSLRQSSQGFLRTPEVLSALGILEDAERGQYTLERADGETFTLQVTPVASDDTSFEYVTLYDGLGIEPPVRMLNPNRNYWYTYLEDLRTIYFHYYRCSDDPEQPFATFNTEMMAFIDSHEVARVVVDLRFNGGGNSEVINPFIEAIRARPNLNMDGKLYVLIGQQTFSSAIMNAIDLNTQTNAILMGESTGGAPNHFGETRAFRLPNSGITVQYSTRFFRLMPGSDADAVMPEVPVSISWADLLAGRDTVLEAAINGVGDVGMEAIF
jgi:hypothetical protein